jgi:hypothetical protein
MNGTMHLNVSLVILSIIGGIEQYIVASHQLLFSSSGDGICLSIVLSCDATICLSGTTVTIFDCSP